MLDDAKMSTVELTLLECGEWLRDATPTPAIRELRVRLGTLTRVVNGWATQPPHSAQLVAMLECALELRAMVARACAPVVSDTGPPPPWDPPVESEPPPPAARSTARPRRAARSTRPPRRDGGTSTTRPPARGRSKSR